MSPVPMGIPRGYDLTVNGLVIPCVEHSDPAVMAVTPLVSVAMITYNHERYIASAIEHVARQERTFPIELIIGEDCSTDRTRQIVCKYQQMHPDLIRMITSEKNVGARRNVLRTTAACRGKYVAFCEGDDYWHHPRKLQIQVDFLESNPEYGLVCSNARSYTVATGALVEKAVPVRPYLSDQDDPYVQLLTGSMLIWVLTVCMRRDLLWAIQKECPECSDESYLMGDTPCYLEAARRTKIKFLPEALATRNLLSESTTRSCDIRKRARFVASGTRLVHHYLQKYPVPADKDKQIREWVAKRSLYYAYLCREGCQAAREMSTLRSLGVRIPARYRFYYWGSRNALAFGLVNAGLFLLLVCAKVSGGLAASCRRLLCLFKRTGEERSRSQMQV